MKVLKSFIILIDHRNFTWAAVYDYEMHNVLRKTIENKISPRQFSKLRQSFFFLNIKKRHHAKISFAQNFTQYHIWDESDMV